MTALAPPFLCCLGAWFEVVSALFKALFLKLLAKAAQAPLSIREDRGMHSLPFWKTSMLLSFKAVSLGLHLAVGYNLSD